MLRLILVAASHHTQMQLVFSSPAPELQKSDQANLLQPVTVVGGCPELTEERCGSKRSLFWDGGGFRQSDTHPSQLRSLPDLPPSSHNTRQAAESAFTIFQQPTTRLSEDAAPAGKWAVLVYQMHAGHTLWPMLGIIGAFSRVLP